MCFSNVNSNINKNLALFQLRWDLAPSISYPREKKKVTWRPATSYLSYHLTSLWLWTLSYINKDSEHVCIFEVFPPSQTHLKCYKIGLQNNPLRNTYIYCLLLSIVQDNFGILLELTSKLFIHTHTQILVSSFHYTHLAHFFLITILDLSWMCICWNVLGRVKSWINPSLRCLHMVDGLK